MTEREYRRRISRASWQKHKDVYLFAKKMRVNIPTARRIIAEQDATQMSYKHRYTVRSIHPPHNQDLETWSIIKFDRDHESEGTYTVSKIYSPSSPSGSLLLCDCFASNKETCRHREMVKIFASNNSIDSGRTYDYDKKRWFEALGFEL